MTAPSRGVQVEQGPTWLARLLYDVPTWLAAALTLVVVAGFIGVIVLFAHVELDADAVAEIATNVSVLVATVAVTRLALGFGFPYLVDVAIGAGVGIVVGYGVVGPLCRRWLEENTVGERVEAYLSSAD